jgi:membrane-associated protease RseP (regulator of RpoE activity)
METFAIVDISLLIAFAIFVSIFLYSKRRNLKKEGWLFLYKTKWGIKLIDRTAKKHPKLLKVGAWAAVILGYILMIMMIYLFIRILWIYLFNADIVRAIKVPPIAPLIPYLPQIFKLDFLPNFYFIYWIIILAVIAITHEFFHGIFAALYKVRIKKTGFGFFPFFLPIFMAAFVELDETVMRTKENFKQRAILAAGTFANILTALFGVLLIFIFFSFSYSPSGVVFDDYAYDVIEVSEITMINGIAMNQPTYGEIEPYIKDAERNLINAASGSYVGIKGTTSDKKYMALYYNAPAINSGIYGPITSINGIDINSFEVFQEELSKYEPGEDVVFTTSVDGEEMSYEFALKEHPDNPEEGWIGVVFTNQNQGVMAKFVLFFSSYKKPHLYYEPIYGAAPFIYDLLWWLIVISFSVALINMLPMGIFDGGRFFYLTVLALTKKEKLARQSFKWITYVLLALVVLIMVFWAKGFI